MTMHETLHPRDDVDRLYVSRKEGGRRLASIEDSLQPSETILIIRWTTEWQYIGKKWEEKQIYGRFKRLLNNISHDETLACLRKGNFKRETESILIATQNNTIRTNHIKLRIDKIQQNSKCRLCGDRDEIVNHIISECSKLAQKKYKTKHDWVGKVIHWEIYKKFKFDHTNKWYMHNPAPVTENDIHKLL